MSQNVFSFERREFLRHSLASAALASARIGPDSPVGRMLRNDPSSSPPGAASSKR